MEIIEEGKDCNNAVKNKLDEKPKCSETKHQSVVRRRRLKRSHRLMEHEVSFSDNYKHYSQFDMYNKISMIFGFIISNL